MHSARRAGRYNANPNLKTVFNFDPLTPPWFAQQLVCYVDNDVLPYKPAKFKKNAIPDKKRLRGRDAQYEMQGLLATFYEWEPNFGKVTIDYLMRKCHAIWPLFPEPDGQLASHPGSTINSNINGSNAVGRTASDLHNLNQALRLQEPNTHVSPRNNKNSKTANKTFFESNAYISQRSSTANFAARG